MSKKPSSRSKGRRRERTKQLRDPEHTAKLRARCVEMRERYEAKLAAMTPEELAAYRAARAEKASASMKKRWAEKKASERAEYGSLLESHLVAMPGHLWAGLRDKAEGLGITVNEFLRQISTVAVYVHQERR